MINDYIESLYFEKKANYKNKEFNLFEMGEWDEIEAIYQAMIQEESFHLESYLIQNIARLERHQNKTSDYSQGGLSILIHLKEKEAQLK